MPTDILLNPVDSIDSISCTQPTLSDQDIQSFVREGLLRRDEALCLISLVHQNPNPGILALDDALTLIENDEVDVFTAGALVYAFNQKGVC